jgi:hypothetical protein
MKQRYTIQLERTILKTATVEVVAEDLKDARDQAIVKGRFSDIWDVDESTTRVLKITAHAGEVKDEPPAISQAQE